MTGDGKLRLHIGRADDFLRSVSVLLVLLFASSIARGQSIDLPSAIPAAEGIADQALLARATRPDAPYRVAFDVGAYNTNNALFGNQNPLSDTYTQYLLSFGGTTPLVGDNLFFNVGVLQAAYRYDRFGFGLNYEYLKVTPGFLYRLSDVDGPVLSFFEGAMLYAMYDYNRYSNDTFLQELYTAHNISLGFLKPIEMTDRQKLVIGVDLEPSLEGNLSENRRHRGWALLAHDIEWTPSISTRCAYKAAYAEFTDIPREDLNHAFLANVNWSIHRQTWGDLHCEFYATGTLNYVINDSNQSNRTYNFFSGGASVGVRASF